VQKEREYIRTSYDIGKENDIGWLFIDIAQYILITIALLFGTYFCVEETIEILKTEETVSVKAYKASSAYSALIDGIEVP